MPNLTSCQCQWQWALIQHKWCTQDATLTIPRVTIIMNTEESQNKSKHGDVALLVGLLTVASLQAASLVYLLTGDSPRREFVFFHSVLNIINWSIYFLVIWWQRKKKKHDLPTQDPIEAQVSDKSDQRGRLYWIIVFLSHLSLLLMLSTKIVYLVDICI